MNHCINEDASEKMPDDDRCWRAVCERDQAYDGTFFFAVLTTGIYCRPSCSSRRARRENVSFFDSADAAEQAGYRACKRCKPNQAVQPPHAEAIIQACNQLQSAEKEPDLATLARQADLSPAHFQRLFKAQVGLSPKQYAIAVRKQRLRDELVKAESVTRAIHDAGYGSVSRAYADRATPGMKPSRYLQGGVGETIRYAGAKSNLGHLVVAATEQGVCLVQFVEPEEMLELLEHHFPEARLQSAERDLEAWIVSIIARIEAPHGERVERSIPLDLRGTAFQERVWNALTEIPMGETISYTQLACSLGKPRAARSVANAIGANSVAVLVPCHRVIRESGELAGYKWGVERKRLLLERERLKAE